MVYIIEHLVPKKTIVNVMAIHLGMVAVLVM